MYDSDPLHYFKSSYSFLLARGTNFSRTTSLRRSQTKSALPIVFRSFKSNQLTVSGNPVELINSHLKSLSDEQKDAFLELSYVDSGSNIPQEDVPLSIFQTNAISAGTSGVGIFPKTARLNHACSAGFNSVYTWREKQKLLGLARCIVDQITVN